MMVVRPALFVALQNPNAESLVFEFRLADQILTSVTISRLGWQVLGPSQAIHYVADRYLMTLPLREKMISRDLVVFHVMQAVGIPPAISTSAAA
ncbi:hypothetical protein FY528_19030 [Hymenobacter lutimineralis]|uniref:Uncharacterized protein n=1 Tax=Hymenobacter lutimineralis TaxID=2606448 RepID=A0A5D6UT32_9BACT|nr:hypothetical protein [Hymenobacter lutimineralis]TYZ06230.1 hypothetical protein FY528_19030 [Hymenobacter lutimineralis]